MKLTRLLGCFFRKFKNILTLKLFKKNEGAGKKVRWKKNN